MWLLSTVKEAIFADDIFCAMTIFNNSNVKLFSAFQHLFHTELFWNLKIAWKAHKLMHSMNIATFTVSWT